MISGRNLRGLPAAGSLATRIAMTGVAGFLAACLFEEPVAEGPSTETGNPALAGILRDTLGRPAAGALVMLYRHGPDTFPAVSPVSPIRLDSFRTDADGAYRFDSLAPATVYAVEASDAARRTFSFLPAAEVPAGAKRFLRRDTLVLKRPGSLSGIARRDSNPRPPGLPDEAGEAGILVRVIGLDRATYTDSAGRYALADIPEGSYRIHFMAADGHFLGEVAGPVAVDAGAAIELPLVVLDWSPFVAPPSPGGLSVTPDSAAGVIHLSWNRVFVSNFDHYRILRSDTLSPAAPDTFRTRDTAYADTVKHLPAGRILQYRVLAVNTLGNVSENPGPRLVPVPVPKDTVPAALDIAALVLSEAEGGVPARALVRLYAIPSAPGPVDSLPRRVALVDSARSGADGRVVFAGRAAGLYTLSAIAEPGGSGAPVAALVGVSPRAGGATDTLRLAASGSLEGTASRQSLWCSNSAKGNENIEISLAGTPWFAVTDYDGKYVLAGLPAGSYRAVAIALPQGCFLPDTVAAVIAPGRATVLTGLPARPNPGFIPKVAGLRVASSAGAAIALEWNPVSSAYPDLQGYEVFRRDGAQAVTAASGLLAGTAWTDDLGALAPGTRVSWVVRAVGKGGAPGPYGGDAAGNPVYYLVP